MADIYLDRDASGANDGTSEADAYTSPTNAGVLAVTAGDTLHIAKGTADYTPSAEMVFTGTGSAVSPAMIVGYNTSFVIDGSRPVFDGASTRSMGFNLGTTQDYYHIYNIEWKNNTAHGITGSSSTDGCVLINCWAKDNGANGINGFRYFRFLQCISSGNAVGIKNGANAGYMGGLLVYDNSSNGVEVSTSIACFITDCVSYDNTGYGIRANHLTIMKNCVLHGNTDDNAYTLSNNALFDGCRITGSGAYGIDATATAKSTYVINSYIPAGGEALANTSGTVNGTIITFADKMTDLNDLAGTDTDGGYEDSTSDDYNIDSTASVYNGSIDVGDGVNFKYVTAGLVPTASGGGGGGGGGALIDGDLVQ